MILINIYYCYLSNIKQTDRINTQFFSEKYFPVEIHVNISSNSLLDPAAELFLREVMMRAVMMMVYLYGSILVLPPWSLYTEARIVRIMLITFISSFEEINNDCISLLHTRTRLSRHETTSRFLGKYLFLELSSTFCCRNYKFCLPRHRHQIASSYICLVIGRSIVNHITNLSAGKFYNSKKSRNFYSFDDDDIR